MPNIKSAKKRVGIIEKKTLRNNMIKSGYKSAVKKFEQAVEAGHYLFKLLKKSIKLAQKVLLLKTQLLEKNLIYQKN